MYSGSATYDPETEARLDQWVQAKRARDYTTSDAIQAELAAQGVDTCAARPDPRKAGANLSGGSGCAGANLRGGNGGTYDPETEAKLDQWVQAKRARDFTTSDAIQAELEAQGVEPKAARPDPRKAGANPWDGSGGVWDANLRGVGGCTYDPETEAKLDQWVQAKSARDFTTSDAIQAELEAQGVEPKAARPDPRKAGVNLWAASGFTGANLRGVSGGTYDPQTEAQLDQWVQAKRARDFTTSDAIQAQLEAQGVDPKAARPDPRKAGANSWDASGGAWDGGSSTMNMMYIDTHSARLGPRTAGANFRGASGATGANLRGGSGGTYDAETEAQLDQWVQAKRARDFTTSDAIQAELEAQGVDTNAARPDPRKAGVNPWAPSGSTGANLRGVSGGTYDPGTEAQLDQWVQAKRARDFTTSDAIQAQLEAQGVDPKAARPDPRKAGANSWDASGGAWDGGSSMMNMMNMMEARMMKMMKGQGGKGLGKGKWGPY